MSDKPTIALHIGVHKTATTYIQSRLFNSRDALHSAGIAYIPVETFRSLITNKLSTPQFNPAVLAHLLDEPSGARRIIISDENIIGANPRANRIYPNARNRLAVIRQALGDYSVEVFVTLRSYPDYLVSRYAEVLRNRAFISFDNFFKTIDFDTVSWLDLLTDIDAAGFSAIDIRDFSTLFQDEVAYFERLLGQAGIPLSEADDTPTVRRTKFSQEGFEVVRCFAKRYAPSASRHIMALIDQIPQETNATPFMPIPEWKKEQMELRYKKEIAPVLSKIDLDGGGLRSNE